MAEFRDIAATAMKESGDFASGLFHSAIENPINAVTQIANKTGLTSIPELHIVDGHNTSVGGTLGNITGAVADFYVLNKVGGKLMGDLGGKGLGGAMLRAGIVGGVYEGVFTPSDANSKNFVGDRFASAGVGFTTFAAMAGAGGLVDKTGLFAVPEARSLAGSITYGGATGLAGGVAHAEANAIFRQGKPIATWQDFRKDATNYALFGAAFGAVGWGENKIDQALNNRTVKIEVKDHRSVEVQMDRSGNPMRITEERPATGGWDDMFVRNYSTKMTNGDWSTSSKGFNIETGKHEGWMPTWKFDTQSISVKPDEIRVMDNDGNVRSYSKNGYYNRDAMASPRLGDPDYVAPDTGARQLKDGTALQLDLKTGKWSSFRTADGASGSVFYKDGELNSVYMAQGGKQVSVHAGDAKGQWKLYMDNKMYDFRGNVELSGGENAPVKITLTADGGKPVTFEPKGSLQPVLEMAGTSAKYVPGGTGNGYVEVNANGEVTLHKGTSNWSRMLGADGKPSTAETVKVKPGEPVQYRVDVGDRYPEYETHSLEWTRDFDGTIRFGGEVVKPNTVFDVVPKKPNGTN